MITIKISYEHITRAKQTKVQRKFHEEALIKITWIHVHLYILTYIHNIFVGEKIYQRQLEDVA